MHAASGPVTNPELSIVVPLFNEEESLPLLVDRLLAALRPLGRSFELVLVDDGPADATAAVFRVLAFPPPERGVGVVSRGCGVGGGGVWGVGGGGGVGGWGGGWGEGGGGGGVGRGVWCVVCGAWCVARGAWCGAWRVARRGAAWHGAARRGVARRGAV